MLYVDPLLSHYMQLSLSVFFYLYIFFVFCIFAEWLFISTYTESCWQTGVNNRVCDKHKLDPDSDLLNILFLITHPVKKLMEPAGLRHSRLTFSSLNVAVTDSQTELGSKTVPVAGMILLSLALLGGKCFTRWDLKDLFFMRYHLLCQFIFAVLFTYVLIFLRSLRATDSPSVQEKREPEPVKLIWDLGVEERQQATDIIHAVHLKEGRGEAYSLRPISHTETTNAHKDHK